MLAGWIPVNFLTRASSRCFVRDVLALQRHVPRSRKTALLINAGLSVAREGNAFAFHVTASPATFDEADRLEERTVCRKQQAHHK